MRGKDKRQVCNRPIARITPAYAGKSSLDKIRQIKMKDHPRLCGEKLTLKNANMPKPGSPPPMRGKVIFNGEPHGTFRITPAYAGKRLFV